MASPHSLALIERVQTIKHQIRLLEADLAEVIVDMDRCDTAKDTGHSRLPSLLSEALHIDRSTANRLVANALVTAEELTPTGHLAPAELPTVREALRDGVIDQEHIHEIAQIMKALPTWVSTADRELVESTLGATARVARPLVVRKHGYILLERLNQDGHEPNHDDKLAEPDNSFSWTRTADGRIKFRGNLEPEIAEVFEHLLEHFGKPQPLGVDDPRSAEQRYGDAMSDIIDLAANPHPQGGHNQPRLILTLDHETLTKGLGTATLESGATLSAGAVRRLACEGDLIPMVLGGKSIPLDRGQTCRYVTDAQRDALIARDKGCAFPHCTRPARICDAHHVVEWSKGGPTDLHNLVLLCRMHHRMLHHPEWKIITHRGLPEFIPPKWVDPLQRPVRNTMRT